MIYAKLLSTSQMYLSIYSRPLIFYGTLIIFKYMKTVFCLSTLFLRMVDLSRENFHFKWAITSGCDLEFKHSHFGVVFFLHHFIIIIPCVNDQSPVLGWLPY